MWRVLSLKLYPVFQDRRNLDQNAPGFLELVTINSPLTELNMTIDGAPFLTGNVFILLSLDRSQIDTPLASHAATCCPSREKATLCVRVSGTALQFI